MTKTGSKLPLGWAQVPIAEVIEKPSLSSIKLMQSDYQEKGELPVIDQGQRFIGGFTDKVELKVLCQLPVIVFGDHTKVLKYVDFDFVAGADGVKVLKPLDLFYPKLFYYFLQTVELPNKGYARHFQFLEKSDIPVPPLPEQHRIVAKIEEIFSRLDAGVESLQRAKAQLIRYRNAMLKAAVVGRLTEEWRYKQKLELEPSQLLLDRILKVHPQKKGRNREKNAKMDLTGLPKLPESWIWVRLDCVAFLKGGLTKDSNRKMRNGRDVPYLRVANVQRGYLDLTEIKEIEAEESMISELRLKLVTSFLPKAVIEIS